LHYGGDVVNRIMQYRN